SFLFSMTATPPFISLTSKGISMKTILCTLSISLLVATSAAFAQTAAPAQGAATKPSQAMTDMVAGEVRKVDKDARKITLRHAEIKQLDMPAMSMVFQVKDPALLEKVKAGDKVKFKAENAGGAMTLTEIETVK
ncbi:MAG: copper-binding protein, partial [Burkholderiaceae bacterium]